MFVLLEIIVFRLETQAEKVAWFLIGAQILKSTFSPLLVHIFNPLFQQGERGCIVETAEKRRKLPLPPILKRENIERLESVTVEFDEITMDIRTAGMEARVAETSFEL